MPTISTISKAPDIILTENKRICNKINNYLRGLEKTGRKNIDNTTHYETELEQHSSDIKTALQLCKPHKQLERALERTLKLLSALQSGDLSKRPTRSYVNLPPEQRSTVAMPVANVGSAASALKVASPEPGTSSASMSLPPTLDLQSVISSIKLPQKSAAGDGSKGAPIVIVSDVPQRPQPTTTAPMETPTTVISSSQLKTEPGEVKSVIAPRKTPQKTTHYHVPVAAKRPHIVSLMNKLWLRPLEPSDLSSQSSFRALFRNERVMQFCFGHRPILTEETWGIFIDRIFNKALINFAAGRLSWWIVESVGPRDFLGCVGFNIRNGAVNVVPMILPTYQGNHVAIDAIASIANYYIANGKILANDIVRVEIHPENTASTKLAQLSGLDSDESMLYFRHNRFLRSVWSGVIGDIHSKLLKVVIPSRKREPSPLRDAPLLFSETQHWQSLNSHYFRFSDNKSKQMRIDYNNNNDNDSDACTTEPTNQFTDSSTELISTLNDIDTTLEAILFPAHSQQPPLSLITNPKVEPEPPVALEEPLFVELDDSPLELSLTPTLLNSGVTFQSYNEDSYFSSATELPTPLRDLSSCDSPSDFVNFL